MRLFVGVARKAHSKSGLCGMLAASLFLLCGCGGGGGSKSAPITYGEPTDARHPPVSGGAYTLIDLGTIGTNGVEPVRITRDNRVIGRIHRSDTSGNSWDGVFLYQPGATLDETGIRDVTPKDYNRAGRNIRVTGINSAGMAVGTCLDVSGASESYACQWRPAEGTGATVNSLPPVNGKPPVSALAISDTGYIVGEVGQSQAGVAINSSSYRYRDGKYTIPTDFSKAVHTRQAPYIPPIIPPVISETDRIARLNCVNDNGDAAGSLEEATYINGSSFTTVRLALLKGDTLSRLSSPDTGDQISRDSIGAVGINATGGIIGIAGSTYPGAILYPALGFVWQDGKYTLLKGWDDTGEFLPSGINTTGTIVGHYFAASPLTGTTGTTWSLAGVFLWRNGTTVDLNGQIAPNSGWKIIGVSDINDAGIICAAATYQNGASRAVLLVPRS